MGRILAITNQKGGVGKTTTSVNLAAALAHNRKKVLLIDLDPQGNATMGCGVDKYSLEKSGFDVLMHSMPMKSVIVPASDDNLDVCPGNADMTAAEVGLLNVPQREGRLKAALKPVMDDYDFIVIDCPPSLSMLTINALVAANGLLVPLQCEYYALEGLSALLKTVSSMQQGPNPGLEVDGVLRTMYDPRTSLAVQVSAQLIRHFGDKLYRTSIPRNIRLAEAPSHGQSVLLYDRSSRGALAYLALASEILRRETQRTAA